MRLEKPEKYDPDQNQRLDQCKNKARRGVGAIRSLAACMDRSAERYRDAQSNRARTERRKRMASAECVAKPKTQDWNEGQRQRDLAAHDSAPCAPFREKPHLLLISATPRLRRGRTPHGILPAPLRKI